MRTINYNKEILTQAEIGGQMVSRFQLAQSLGMSYGGVRDLYTVLGYDKDIDFNKFWGLYRRHEIANTIISKPAKRAWKGDVQLIETKEAEDTAFEKSWKVLWKDKKLKLKPRFLQLDKMTGLGKYGVMLMGFNDVQVKEDFQNPVVKTALLKLMYLKVFSSEAAKILTYEENPMNERYGMPLTYQVSNTDTKGGNYSLIVHYSRVIHTVEESMENDLESPSRLEVVYNRLKDLEKLTGGSAEMFWRGARPGYAGKADEKHRIDNAYTQELKDQITEYEHDLRRILVTEGVDLSALTTQISDPKAAIDVQLEMIAAQTNIPKRILTGSERGELSSGQDADEWSSYIQDRRDDFCEPEILRPFVDRCIDLGILEMPSKGEYSVQWENLSLPSTKDKVDVGKTRASALKEYASTPVAESIVPIPAFFEFFLGMSPDEIELITQMAEENNRLRMEQESKEIEEGETEDEQTEDEQTEQDLIDEIKEDTSLS